jgi:hypothetical protein
MELVMSGRQARAGDQLGSGEADRTEDPSGCVSKVRRQKDAGGLRIEDGKS